MTLPVPTAADAFLMRLDGTGARINAKAFTASDDQFGASLVAAGSKLYASFEVAGTMTFNGGSDFLTSSANAGSYNAATVRFDLAEQSSGLATFRGTLNVLAKGSALGAGESVISFGDWDSAISVNGVASVMRTNGKPGLFVVRSFILSASDIVNTDLCDDGTSCIASAIGSNPTTGESLLGGRFTGHISGVDGGAGVTSALSDNDAYLMKLGPNLGLAWVLSLEGTGSAEVLAVTALPGTTDFVAAGVFGGSLQAPGQSAIAANDSAEIFVVRVDTTGKVVWLRSYGSAGEDRVRAITADGAGNIFLAGTFKGPTLDLGKKKLQNADTTGLGTADVFVAWLDSFGVAVYGARFGDGAGNEDVAAIGLDATGNVVIAGAFDRTIDFGTGVLTARGRTDMFVTKLHR
jgi:hypothetical protein